MKSTHHVLTRIISSTRVNYYSYFRNTWTYNQGQKTPPQGRMPASKPDDQSLIPVTPMVERDNQFSQVVLPEHTHK